jgi:hypothetical protein
MGISVVELPRRSVVKLSSGADTRDIEEVGFEDVDKEQTQGEVSTRIS